MRFTQIGLVALALSLLASGGPPVSRGVEPDRPATKPVRAGVSGSKLTPECRRSIDRGTQWLVSVMRVDGSVGTDQGQPPDLSCTAMVGLTLLSQGNTPAAGPYSAELRRILDAVLNMVERLPDHDAKSKSITLVQRKIGRNADLFISALFLSQVLGEAPEAESDVRRALEHLVTRICNSQGKDGTWGDESWAPVLGTVLGWESLRASASAGLRIDASARAAGEALLAKLKAKNTDERNWMHDFYKEASSIRVLYSLNYRQEPVFDECVKRILRIAHEDPRPFTQAGGEEFLAFFLVTECLLQERQPSWQSWYPTVRDKIIRVQNNDGSWSGHHCITARTFCTAAAMLTLQATNLYMPASNL